MIMPVTLSVITSAFPDDQRSKAIGIWTGVAGGGGILGMFLSAVLVDYLTWRWLFALPVLLAIIGLVYFLHEGPNYGWTGQITIAGLLPGSGAAIAFVAWELRQTAPLLGIRLFLPRSLSTGSVVLLTWFDVWTGVFIVLYPLFQALLG